MTTAQRIKLMSDWWPAAAEAQSWNARDRWLRLRVLSFAVSAPPQSAPEFVRAVNSPATPRRSLLSAAELNSGTDVDRVKAVLGMLANKLSGAQETTHAHAATARRKRRAIGDVLRCLALYPLDAPMAAIGAERLMSELIRDMFDGGRAGSIVGLMDLDDEATWSQDSRTGRLREGPSQLSRLLMRLTAMLNGAGGYRARAGHSIHDMLDAAGLPCHCAACRRARSPF